MKDYLKSYGVITVIAIFFIGIITFFGLDQSKQVVPGKNVGGEDIAFKIGDKNVTADEYYNELFELYGIETVAALFEMSVADEGIQTTDELKETAKVFATNTRSSYAQNYGQAEGDKILGETLEGLGYENGIDDLDAFFLTSIKASKVSEEYINNRYDEIVAPYFEEFKPRLLSHILIQMEDPNNPTEEESARMQAVDDALASGESFEQVAATYSDDTGSAVANGYLGLSNTTTSYVPEFLAASLELNEGEISQWVQTQYGFHLIRCDAATYETILEKEPDSLYEAILTNDPKIKSLALWKKAEELGVSFMNDEIKQQLLEFYDIQEEVKGE